MCNIVENQIKEILDDKGIKYEFKKDDYMQLFRIFIIITDGTVDDEERIVLDIVYKDMGNDTKYILVSCNNVYKVPSRYREKIKNFLLDYNIRSIIGSFGILKGEKEVVFSRSIFLDNNNGQALVRKSLSDEIDNILVGIYAVKKELSKMCRVENDVK